MVLLDIKKYNRELTFRSFLPAGRQARPYISELSTSRRPRVDPKNRSKSTPCYIAGSTRNCILAFLFFWVTLHFSLVTVSNAESPKRIISLAPGITEILFAAGLGDRVVGVTTFCDFPEEAGKKPKIGGMSNPSLEAVISLKPDMVVMTTDGNPREFEQRLRSMKINTHVFKALKLSELPDGIRKIGNALDEKKRFDSLALEIEISIDKFRGQGIPAEQSVPGALPKGPDGPSGGRSSGEKVLFIVWPEPLIVAGRGTAIDDAIQLLGLVNIAGDAKSRYPKYSLEEIFRRSPDVIFIGKGHEDMRKLSSNLLKRISLVPAVRDKKVFYVSDSLYRLGPRVVKGMEELSGYLNK